MALRAASLLIAVAVFCAGMPMSGHRRAATGSLDLAEAVISVRDLAGAADEGRGFADAAARAVVRMRAAAGLDAAWTQASNQEPAGQSAPLWMGLAPAAGLSPAMSPATLVPDSCVRLAATDPAPPEPPPDNA